MRSRIVLITAIVISTALVLTWAVIAQAPEPREHWNAQVLSAPSAGAQEPASDIELIRQLGGSTWDVVVEADRAYIGMGPRLVILDISQPENPTLVGKTNILSGVVESLAVSGGYAYVALDTAGLSVIDLSNPGEPSRVGSYSTSGGAQGIAVQDTTVYLTERPVWQGTQRVGGGLRLLSAADPTNPAELGFHDTPGYARDVVVRGDCAYIGDGGDGGLRIVDITDPANPTEVGSLDSIDAGLDIVLVGDYAYIADGWMGGLKRVDISDPSDPTSAGSYDTPGLAMGLAVHGDYAYVGEGHSVVRVFDISTYPRLLARAGTIGDANHIEVSDGHAFVAARSGGLRVMNLSDPAQPVEVGSYNPLGGIWETASQEGYLYAAVTDIGLQVLDLSDNARPSPTGLYQAPAWVRDVAVSGEYAYVTAGHYNKGFNVVNVADPTAPYEMGSWCNPGNGSGLAASGDYAYIADGDSGLQVVDTTDPNAPVGISSVAMPNRALNVTVAGDYAYVADTEGLRIVDVSSPSAPSRVSGYEMPDGLQDVEVSGDYAYAVGDALWVMNISNPLVPTEVSTLTLPSAGRDAVLSGSRLYVADSSTGLRVINVSDPLRPAEAASYDTPGQASSVMVDGGHIYVGDGDGGMTVLWYVPPVTGTIPTEGGELSSPVDKLDYRFESGTFTDTVLITHTVHYPGNVPPYGDLTGIDHVFDATAVYSSTGQLARPTTPYTVSIQYTDAEKGPAVEDTLELYWWDGETWSQEGISSTVDTADNVVTAQVDHFSLFAVLGETNRVYLPLALRGP